MLVMIYVTGGLGIALGFHRTLTHRSLALWKPLEYAATVFGCLALQGSPIDWVVTHRIHHAKTDREGDPHDANAGFRWSHFLWMVMPNPNFALGDERSRYAPDLFADPVYVFLDKYWLGLTAILGVVLFAFGGWSWVVWGIFARLALVYQFTWLVNSAAHTIGYRSFTHRRPLDELLVGRAARLGRGLAQQPPCVPVLGAPRFALVRARRHLDLGEVARRGAPRARSQAADAADGQPASDSACWRRRRPA